MLSLSQSPCCFQSCLLTRSQQSLSLLPSRTSLCSLIRHCLQPTRGVTTQLFISFLFSFESMGPLQRTIALFCSAPRSPPVCMMGRHPFVLVSFYSIPPFVFTRRHRIHYHHCLNRFDSLPRLAPSGTHARKTLRNSSGVSTHAGSVSLSWSRSSKRSGSRCSKPFVSQRKSRSFPDIHQWRAGPRHTSACQPLLHSCV